MSYYLHRLRCFLALISTLWAQSGAETHHAEWKFDRDVAKRRRAHAEDLARQLVEMRKMREGGQ